MFILSIIVGVLAGTFLGVGAAEDLQTYSILAYILIGISVITLCVSFYRMTLINHRSLKARPAEIQEFLQTENQKLLSR